MTYEELSIGGKAVCIALALSPFWMGWLGEQFGKWLRRKYDERKARKRKNRHSFCP